MDVIATRHSNLKALVDKLTSGGRSKKEAALALDMSASYLSQLVGGKKMGDDVARKIEVAAGLSHGWMDTQHTPRVGEQAPFYVVSQPARLSPEILAAALKLMRLACENLGLSFDPETSEDASLVIMAGAYLIDRDEQTVTVDNVVDFTRRLRERGKREDDDEGFHSARRSGRSTGQ